MSTLYLYTIFHANLNFSSVPKEYYGQVIRDCYWPLLEIIEESGVPLGLEFSAYTLQLIHSIEPKLINKLRHLWGSGSCEIVGSGYVQSIMPLIPAEVNRANLRIGNEIYKDLLGDVPDTAYINEQVYSAGLPELYKKAGYTSLMVNWESSLESSLKMDSIYSPHKVPLSNGGFLPIIWHSTLAYRDFQKYVEGEISKSDYLNSLLCHRDGPKNRSFPLYSSDWEVFDFKPWTAQPTGFRGNVAGEMDRIAELLKSLRSTDGIEIVAPHSVLSNFVELPTAKIVNTVNPLTYKKQDLHSVGRWAVCGREGTKLNSQCFELYQNLMFIEWGKKTLNDQLISNEEKDRLWMDLCLLWSSDYRTFTTEEKYLESRNLMGAALSRTNAIKRLLIPSEINQDGIWLVNCSPVPAVSVPTTFDAMPYDSISGDMCGEIGLNIKGSDKVYPVVRSVSGETQQTTVVSNLAPGEHQIGIITDKSNNIQGKTRAYTTDPDKHYVDTGMVKLALSKTSGASIRGLSFPTITPAPVISQPKGIMPKSVWLADNDYPGGMVVEDCYGKRFNDHQMADIQYPDVSEYQNVFITIRCTVRMELGTIWKTYRAYLDRPRLDVNLRFRFNGVSPRLFRVGRMTLNASIFESSSLAYSTVNGGDIIEKFPLAGTDIRQDEPLHGSTSSSGCLGATEGWVVLSDSTKGVGFITDLSGLYSVPMMHYEESSSKSEQSYMSLVYSLGEFDDTSHTFWRGHSEWNLSIIGGQNDVINETREAALLFNGGLTTYSAATSSLI